MSGAEKMCKICLEPCDGEDVELGCKDVYCHTCMGKYILGKMEALSVRILCPICKKIIPDNLLEGLVGLRPYEQWKEALMKKKTEAMDYCRSCTNKEPSKNRSKCQNCNFEFCTRCRIFHLEEMCLIGEERVTWIQKRQLGSELAESEKEEEKHLLENILSMMEALKEGNRCPNCMQIIQKTEGCNKVQCALCNTFFCFLCGISIEEGNYNHFNAGVCPLFEDPGQNDEPEVEEEENEDEDGDEEFADWALAMAEGGD